MITDIGMPNMSGWQLAERIKGKYPGMKVALVTVWVADFKNAPNPRVQQTPKISAADGLPTVL